MGPRSLVPVYSLAMGDIMTIDTSAVRARVQELTEAFSVSTRELALTGLSLACEIVDELRAIRIAREAETLPVPCPHCHATTRHLPRCPNFEPSLSGAMNTPETVKYKTNGDVLGPLVEEYGRIRGLDRRKKTMGMLADSRVGIDRRKAEG